VHDLSHFVVLPTVASFQLNPTQLVVALLPLAVVLVLYDFGDWKRLAAHVAANFVLLVNF